MRIALAFASLAMAASPASAASIVGLYNTGVDNNGAQLASINVQDLHYVLNGTGTPLTYTHPAYAAASDAVFLAAGVNGGYANPVNTYTLTFSLAGLDPTTASLSGNFAADNDGQVYLNGNLLLSLTGSTMDNLTQFHAFSANSGFAAGDNVLSFVISDTVPDLPSTFSPSAFGVSGLRGSAASSEGTPAITLRAITGAVPEPTTWALMIVGFGAVGGAMRRSGRMRSFAVA